MAVDRDRFWTEIDNQTVNGASRRVEAPTPLVTPSAPIPMRSAVVREPVTMPVAAQEWAGVLDIINGAKEHAEAQKDQLLEQAETFRQTIQELRREAETIRQQVRVSEAQAQEAKAEAERQVSQTLAQAEERVRAIQAKADAQIAEARAFAQRAEERAVNAEGWLKRIEEAARTLAPTLETPSIH